MKSEIEPQIKELVRAVGELVVVQQQLARQAEQQYSSEVDSILRDQCCDSQCIELLLDRMLDFCFDDEMLRLYKKLCRYYFKINPEGTVLHVNAYREMWDEEVNFKGEDQ